MGSSQHRRGIGGALALLLLGALGAAPARAADAPATRVYGSTETYLVTRQILDPGDPTSRLFQLPIYEYLTVGADDVGVKGLSLEVRGFGVLQPLNRADEHLFTGDLLVGTLSYRGPKGRIQAVLGRQLRLTGTGGLVLMDGASVKVRPGADMTIEAYGGWMPDARFEYALDRAAFGARLAWEPWDWGRIGLSWAGEHDRGVLSRSALGLDYGLRAVRNLEVSGFAAMDLQTLAFQETRNTIGYRINRNWRVAVDLAYYDPVARLPLTSIFRVFTDKRNVNVGGEVAFTSNGALYSSFRGRYFNYGGQSHGYEVGWKPNLRFTRGRIQGATGIDLVYLKGPDNGYFEVRAFGSIRPVRIFEIAAEVDNYVYDKAVRGWEAWRRADPAGATAYRYTGSGGYTHSHVVGLTAGVDVFHGARLQGDVAVTMNPDFTQRWSGLLKFQYAFDKRVK